MRPGRQRDVADAVGAQQRQVMGGHQRQHLGRWVAELVGTHRNDREPRRHLAEQPVVEPATRAVVRQLDDGQAAEVERFERLGFGVAGQHARSARRG